MLDVGCWMLDVLPFLHPPPMPKVFLKTYGCQMNERDSEQVARMLVERGYEMTPREAEADVVLLNTCSVRDMAEQKAIGKMGLLGRLRANKPEMVFGLLCCMAEARGAELTRDLGHVSSAPRDCAMQPRSPKTISGLFARNRPS